MTTADTRTLARWTIDDVTPDTGVHVNVEVRELQFDPRGVHMTHVRIYGGRGAKIVGTVHDDEHETIYVLRGAVVADIDGQRHTGLPGTIFNIPAGAVHGYTPIRLPSSGLVAMMTGEEPDVVELLAIYNPAF
ncbi:MAG TPA: cupin domain-containing protein [Candidatus Saccharimonadales bacterium]|nr:cupin domain-containing protein [Candidatus Saccharimonadales bacterium]